MKKQLLVFACLLGVSSFAQQRDSLPGGGGARAAMTMPPGMGGGAGMRGTQTLQGNRYRQSGD